MKIQEVRIITGVRSMNSKIAHVIRDGQALCGTWTPSWGHKEYTVPLTRACSRCLRKATDTEVIPVE